ncbi:MAG: type I-B CRISPR-associated protein Cas5b [Ignavibacterium sp.]|nr:type I-B CRISPR-associated protein Cas5b [Ignavibacterium sp.]
MKILRLQIYQPQAHYRIPFTYQRRHTYPIPPYSTVIGFLINLLGIYDQSSNDYQRGILDLKISITGKFTSKTTEMIWFRNLAKDFHEQRFGYYENRMIGGHLEHFGGQSQMFIDVLHDVYLFIYLYHNDESFLQKIYAAILNPKDRLEVLHLGRAEDWIVFIDLPKFLEDNIEISERGKHFHQFIWIPEKVYQSEKIEFDFNKFDGIYYNLPTFAEIENYQNTFDKNGKRYFKYMRTKLNDGKISQTKFLIDKELELPIFLGDLNYERDNNLG